jgi:hypothetical protein
MDYDQTELSTNYDRSRGLSHGALHSFAMRSAPEQKSEVGDSTPKGWRRPVLRKLPIAETATKGKGNEGQGGGKGENVIVS